MNHSGLYPLLPPPLRSLSEEAYKTENLKIVQTTTNYVFGILNGYVWRNKLEKEKDFLNYAKNINEEYEELSNEDTLDETESSTKKINMKKSNENEVNVKKTNKETSKNENDENNVKRYDHLNILLFNPVFPFCEDLKKLFDYNLPNGGKIVKDDKDEVMKEYIYIEMLKKVLMDEMKELNAQNELNAHVDEKESIAEDKQFIYIKVPTSWVKKSVYIKVPRSALEDDKPTKELAEDEYYDRHNGKSIQDLVRMEIVQTFKRDDLNNKWELKDITVKNFYKYNKLDDEKIIDGFELVKYDDNITYEESSKIKKINDSNQWNLICTEIEKFDKRPLRKIKFFDINNIAVVTKFGLFIYYFDKITRSISLNYFCPMIYYTGFFEEMKTTLPLPVRDSFKLDVWVSYLKGNKECFLKYGAELLTFVIKEHMLELVEEIYCKCINYFEEDVNNKMFLSIITSKMKLLNKYYPLLISRYISETDLIIDSCFYEIVEYQNSDLHLHSFCQKFQTVNLTQSISWNEYIYKFQDPNNSIFNMLIFIQILFFPLLLLLLFSFLNMLIPIQIIQMFFFPFSLLLFCFPLYILSKFHFINDIYQCDALSIIYFYIYFNLIYFFDIVFFAFSKQKSSSVIIFIIPYIKFVNYPKDYYWLLDWIKPKPSPFVETVHCKEIYKTWNGEALINFKWNTYGKYYYALIWIGFIAFLGCFTVVATLPQEYLTEEKKEILLNASIILGFIHLSFEIRQIIYSPIKWINDFWNYLGM